MKIEGERHTTPELEGSLPQVPTPASTPMVVSGNPLHTGWAGMALGSAFVIPGGDRTFTEKKISDAEVELEYAKFEKALKYLQEKYLQAERDHALKADNKLGEKMAEVYSLCVNDPDLGPCIKKMIAKLHCNAATAVDNYFAVFNKSVPSHFVADGDFLREELINLIEGAGQLREQKLADMKGLKTARILVANSLSPVEAASLDPTYIQALVLAGNFEYDSHICLICQSLNIPLIVAAKGPQGVPITAVAKDGDFIIADASSSNAFSASITGKMVHGNVIINPDSEITAQYRKKADEKVKVTLIPLAQRNSITADLEEVRLRGVVNNLSDLADLRKLNVRGISLVRSELLLINQAGEVASDEKQIDTYIRILKSVSPDEVNIRAFDIRLGSSTPEHQHDDKSLELRRNLQQKLRASGSNESLDSAWDELYSEILRKQVHCILKAHVQVGNARIFFPMVEDVDEFKSYKQIVVEEWQKISGQAKPKIAIGAMVESTRGLLAAEGICRAADFVCMGTGDFTNSVLKTARGTSFRPLHPAVIQAHQVFLNSVKAVKEDYRIYVCGPMVQPYYVPVLLGLGYRGFSLGCSEISKVNGMLSKIDTNECEALVAGMHQSQSEEQSVALLDTFHRKLRETPEQQA